MNTATIQSHFIFYGNAAIEETGKAITSEIETMYNAANAVTFINGELFKIAFSITFELATEKEVLAMLKVNADGRKLFVRIEDDKPAGKGVSTNRSEMCLGDNCGFFVTSDNLGKSTTAAHEYGHSLGLVHPDYDLRGRGNPGIMAARGTLVDTPWRYDGWEKTGYEGVDPAKRTVTPADIEKVIAKLNFNNDGFADIGTSSNRFYNRNGEIENVG